MLVLDSGGLSLLVGREPRIALLIRELARRRLWPPVVPTVVLVESLTGSSGRDARTNQFLKSCLVEAAVSEPLARRAAQLRTAAGRGSAVDALVVALAEPGGTVLTSDPGDLSALSANALDVAIEVV